MRPLALGCSLTLLAFATLAGAQQFSTAPCQGDSASEGGWFFGHQEHACELRRTVFPLSNGHLHVTGKNGGIEVIGENRSDVALEVKVTAQGSSREDAESTLHAIRIVTGPDVHAEGPGEVGLHRGWSASFRLHVPRQLAADLRTINGGITVAGIEGELSASTTNGGLSLHDLAGSVHAQTTNGGVDITLAGERWRGEGLFAKSTNGGVTVKAPEHFAAHLVAQTINGGISVGFPITVQGKIGRHIETDLNGGGPPVHLETTNGGVTIDRI